MVDRDTRSPRPNKHTCVQETPPVIDTDFSVERSRRTRIHVSSLIDDIIVANTASNAHLVGLDEQITDLHAELERLHNLEEAVQDFLSTIREQRGGDFRYALSRLKEAASLGAGRG